MRGQLYEQDKNIYEAQQAYRNGVCFNSFLSKQKNICKSKSFAPLYSTSKVVMKASKIPT